MEELTILREFVSDQPNGDDAARAEVWQRLSHARSKSRKRRRLGFASTLVAATAVCGAVALTFRGGSVGVTTAQAACTGRGATTASCLQALAETARARAALAPLVYQRVLEYG